MYLTFWTKAKAVQLTMEDLMMNPYITFEQIPKLPIKKHTVEITTYYGQELYNKRNPVLYMPDMDYVTEWDTSKMYKHFEIPKKSNPKKKRPIDAPDEKLKAVQTMYKHLIEDSLKVLPHKAAHAYTEKQSIVTNSEQHQKNESKWFLHLDLKDFFNSINGEWLRKMMLEVYPFPFIPENHLNNIIHLALLNNELPQGSVLSPTLTNIVMVPIDHEITETLHNYNDSHGKKYHYVYTRYADDITISCKYKFDFREIIEVIKDIFKEWEAPFTINDEKTRFTSTSGKNYNLGLIINKDNKISAGHERNNKFRAMIYNFCTVGEEWDRHDVQRMLGLISYYKSFEPDFVNKVIAKYNNKFNMDIISKAKKLIS